MIHVDRVSLTGGVSGSAWWILSKLKNSKKMEKKIMDVLTIDGEEVC